MQIYCGNNLVQLAIDDIMLGLHRQDRNFLDGTNTIYYPTTTVSLFDGVAPTDAEFGAMIPDQIVALRASSNMLVNIESLDGDNLTNIVRIGTNITIDLSQLGRVLTVAPGVATWFMAFFGVLNKHINDSRTIASMYTGSIIGSIPIDMQVSSDISFPGEVVLSPIALNFNTFF